MPSLISTYKFAPNSELSSASNNISTAALRAVETFSDSYILNQDEAKSYHVITESEGKAIKLW